MKKTLIALMVLAGVAVAQDADVTFTTTNSLTTATGGFSAKGFLLNLNGSALTTTSTPAGTKLEGLVELQSITLDTGTANSWAEDGKFSLVITDTNFSIVGWSTTSSTASTASYKWTFVSGTNDAAVVLDSAKDYLVLADSATSFTLGSTLIKNNKQMRFSGTGVINYGAGKLDFNSTTTGIYNGLEFVNVADPGDGNSYASYTLDKSDQYAPNITIETKAVETTAVPEPTTATLSLLALAGLAARRRRK